jgi:hypothetical protein
VPLNQAEKGQLLLREMNGGYLPLCHVGT